VALLVTAALSVPVVDGVAAVTGEGAVPAKLVGRWSRNFTLADWKGTDFTGVGVFSMVVKPSGAVQVYLPGGGTQPWLTTRFSPSSGRITVRRIPLCVEPNGLYEWKVVGRLLTIGKLSDDCLMRARLFAGRWKKK
jgi:hypothetical protein